MHKDNSAGHAESAEFAWSVAKSEQQRRERSEASLRRLTTAALELVDENLHGEVTLEHARQWDSAFGRLAAELWALEAGGA